MPEFKFSSLNDFITMAGHGIYVWSCVLIAAVILSALVIHPLVLHRSQKRHILRQRQLQGSQQARHQRSAHTP